MIQAERGKARHLVSVAPMLESIKNGATLSNCAAFRGMAQLLAQLDATIQALPAQESTDANST